MFNVECPSEEEKRRNVQCPMFNVECPSEEEKRKNVQCPMFNVECPSKEEKTRNVQCPIFNVECPSEEEKRKNIQCKITNIKCPSEGGTEMEIDKNKKTKKYNIELRLIDFSISIIDIVEGLPNTRVGNHIANQLVRCGTSPAANYGEAQSAESRSDFIHKMRVSLKELRETRIWLLIIQRKILFKSATIVSEVLKECCELIAIFAASINTAKKKG